MKIIESEEESNENRKGFSATQSRGRRKSRKSVAHSALKLSGDLSEDSLDDDDDLTAETSKDRVPTLTPRGRGSPRKNTLVADAASPLAKASGTPSPGRGSPRKNTLVTDAVSPLAKVSGAPSPGKGRPRKETSLTKSPLMKDFQSPSERKGRGRPKKVADGSDVIKSMTKKEIDQKEPDETANTDATILREKDSQFPSERKGRGRPKKVADGSDVIKSMMKKEIDEKEPGEIAIDEKEPDEKENTDATVLSEKADSVPRRGRGRPKKNFGSLGASTSFSEGKSSSTPRRGRGRPKKNFKNVGGTPLGKGRVGHQNDVRRKGAIELLAQALAKHGRGRPRKGTGLKDAVQLLQKDPDLPKPGRGRPPKSIKRMFAMKLLAKAMAIGCQDEAPKNISIADVTKKLKDAAGTSPRGRGRPKKIMTVPATVSEKPPSVTPRGRGRPRKHPGAPETTLSPGKAPASTPGTPRGRGRPRKSLATVDTPVLSSKDSFSAVMMEEFD